LTNAAKTVKPNRLLPFRGSKDIPPWHIFPNVFVLTFAS